MSHEKHFIAKKNTKWSDVNKETYLSWYRESIKHPDTFWSKIAKNYITWIKPWEKVLIGDFAHQNVRWFEGATLNAAYNCLDRHLPQNGHRIAIIWEGDNPKTPNKKITYNSLHEQVSRLANALRQLNVTQGDCVCIYMPMIPEAIVAMLACARLGAMHSVVFAGFSAAALKARLLDANCKIVITANEGLRGQKIIPLKSYVDEAIAQDSPIKKVIVVKHTDTQTAMDATRDIWYHEITAEMATDCPYTEVSANHPLFILYTSGSTGKPKGIQHSTGGYLVYAAMTFKTIFDYEESQIFWSSADIGWITGHTYSVYGPLALGATIVIYEGIPTYPTPSRYWEIIDKLAVNIFYTSPTAIRALQREGDEWLKSTTRQSLHLLGSVGEPINPETWEWYFHQVGNERCPIVDTWWQTETGGIMVSPITSATPLKPGSASWPFFGVELKIVDDAGLELADGQMGKLVITKPWPGIMQTIHGDAERFKTAYFTEFSDHYSTGDQAKRDDEGYYWIIGRSDDVIKVSGHRIGTQEVESALVSHEAVAEAAVVPIDDEIKGQAIYAFVSLKKNYPQSHALKMELINVVRDEIGPIATPKIIQFAKDLPKTRSGKIMRRLLRKIANHHAEDLGDLSTLADPQVIENLIQGK